MYVRHLLAINVAAFAAMGTMLLGMGQRNSMLPVLMLIAAAVSVWVTDIAGLFRLNRKIANIAVLLAVLRSLWELFHIQGVVQVMAIAHLLAYVQMILLFQEKDSRIWWHIMLLSLLQTASAATFYQDAWFAPLLIIYFFVGLSAVSLLFLHQERIRYHQARHVPIVANAPKTRAQHLAVDWGRLGKIAMATLVVGPVSLFLQYGDSRRRPKPPAPPPSSSQSRRWPLAAQQAEFTGSADRLGGTAGVGLELWIRLAATIPVTLLIAGMVFALVPRVGRIGLLPRFSSFSLGGGNGQPLKVAGFSDTVELGALGMLIEDPQVVMNAQFTFDTDGNVQPLEGEVYFRGALLTHYAAGKWEFRGSGYRPRLRESMSSLAAARPGSVDGLVRQTIAVKPLQRQELFCVWPFVPIYSAPDLLFDSTRERLLRHRSQANRSFTYSLGTLAIVDGAIVPLVSSRWPIDPDHLLDLPDESLPQLIALADQWVEQADLAPDDVIARARLLERQLGYSDRFRYSLKGQPRDPGVDPIEDFVTSHPQGHCEYFATALALMLRSQGIPSRMVIGYKTIEYNPLGEYYRVRQRDAHAWVEAYVAPQHLPENLPWGDPRADWSAGGWLRLDPTPAGDSDVAAMTAMARGVGNWVDWVKTAWSEYVVRMDSARQKKAVYDPLRTAAVEVKRRLADPAWWQSAWANLGRLPAAIGAFFAEGRWLSGIAMLAMVAAMLYLGYRLARRGVAKILARLVRPARSARYGDQAQVAFYRRLESLLARQGLKRPSGKTQREFAREAGARIANLSGREHLDRLPRMVADAFYRVRFGRQGLDNRTTEAVEQALEELERAVNVKR